MEEVEVRLIGLRSTVAITTALSAGDFPSKVSSCGKPRQSRNSINNIIVLHLLLK